MFGALLLLALAGTLGFNALDAALAATANEGWAFFGFITFSSYGAGRAAWALAIAAVVLLVAAVVTVAGRRRSPAK